MTNKIFKDIIENYQKGNFNEALKLCNETKEDKNLHTIYNIKGCLLYTSPSPRDLSTSRMPSSA